jgi:16S rRNA (adenine1518-N6/adenine1519-N6)-dimethyltransferase
MKQLLATRQIQLTKSLGQNFMHDSNQLKRIVDAADLKATDKVLEIGPGLGPLTELLLKQAGEVLAIEMDERLAKALKERFGSENVSGDGVNPKSEIRERSAADSPAQNKNAPSPPVHGEGATRRGVLHLVRDDALDYLKCQQRDWTGWKLVANLPYSVASPILVELAQSKRGPERMVATLQLEVARRLMADEGGGEYGVLTLLVQLNYKPELWFKIPAGCFFPEPDVDSACICLVRRDPPLLTPGQTRTFVKVVKRSFSQRRKMMCKLLRADWPAEKLASAFQSLGLSLQARAESLSLEQYADLTRLLNTCHE